MVTTAVLLVLGSAVDRVRDRVHYRSRNSQPTLPRCHLDRLFICWFAHVCTNMSARLSVEVRDTVTGAGQVGTVLLCFPPKVKADSWLASDYVAILQSHSVRQVIGIKLVHCCSAVVLGAITTLRHSTVSTRQDRDTAGWRQAADHNLA
jgi:hypothetical protein